MRGDIYVHVPTRDYERVARDEAGLFARVDT